MFYKVKRILEIFMYVKLVDILYKWFLCKRKRIGICGTLLSIMSVLRFILSDAHFCLFYEKIIVKFETVL